MSCWPCCSSHGTRAQPAVPRMAGSVADTGPLRRIDQEGATGRGSAASLCRGSALDRLLAYHPGMAGLELLGHCQLVRLGQILSYRPPR